MWRIGPLEKMGEEGVFGISLWKPTHPALQTPPALQDQEVEIEKDLEEGEEVVGVEEGEVVVVVEEEEVVAALVAVVAVEEVGCRPSQPTAICQPSWAT